ncbi:MAG: VCBS domain-containing protein, partial [Pseudomonadota bacterium]
MSHKVIFYAVLFATLAGCGSDRDSTPRVEGSNGIATISGDAVVGGTLSVSIADSDGVQAGSESFQWVSDGSAITGATSTTYELTSNEGRASVSVIARYTDNAGLRETVQSASVVIQAAFSLSAVYVHGLVDGAVCEISAVDATGVVVSPALGSGTTAGGSVSFGDLVPVDGAAFISCIGGTYIDEATGATLDAPPTRAVVDVDGNATFTVSPLTEIATQLAEAAGDLNTAISTYNAATAVNFGIGGDITLIAPTDLAAAVATNDNAGRYATALALISQLDATDSAATAADVINGIGTDLVDGTFAQSTVDDFNAAVMNLAMSPVAGNLDSNALLVVQSAINNAPEPAVFDGLSATIPNDQTDALTGTVTVTDVNFGEDQIVAQTDVQTTYGTFSITEGGIWTYTLNTSDPAVDSLDVGGSINDTIVLTSADGTTATLVIRITALTQVVEITNTINGDTGELRRDLDPHLLQGRLKFEFLKTVALADDGNEKDAYITLYGSSGSSSESLVDLRIQGNATNEDGSPRAPRFLVRNTDNAAYPGGIIEAPFTPNEWYDIEIIWDMSQTEQITILINGEPLGGGAFSTAAVVDSDFVDLDQWFSEGVERIQWRFGDNGTVIPFGSYFVDNIEIYSDTAGTMLQFSDDFESYTVGDSFSGSTDYPNSVDANVSVFDAGAGGGNTPAAFFNLVGAINSDSTDVLMDMVTIIDPDAGEDLLVEQNGTATQYGTFSILPSGTWEYTLDTTDPT